MTDQELLRTCLEAFRALKTADESNKFLKAQGEPPRLYTGSGQFKVRGYMLDLLHRHLFLPSGAERSK